MAATKDDIRMWLNTAENLGHTHVIVVCDTYDHDDYPVYVTKDQDVKEIEAKYRGENMQRVMEVYSLTGKHTIQDQLNEHRAFHYD